MEKEKKEVDNITQKFTNNIQQNFIFRDQILSTSRFVGNCILTPQGANLPSWRHPCHITIESSAVSCRMDTCASPKKQILASRRHKEQDDQGLAGKTRQALKNAEDR